MTTDLNTRLIAYADQLGNPESKKLIRDACEEISRLQWKLSVADTALTNAVKWLDEAAEVHDCDLCAESVSLTNKALALIEGKTQ